VLTHSKVLYALWRRALPANTPQVLLGSVGIFASDSSKLTPVMRRYIASLAIGINQHNRTRVLLYGYATSKDSANGSALLSLQRALAVETQLNLDLTSLNDVGVRVHAVGEGRLSNSVLASFRNVEVFAN
jgi:outer membrane protein OmpA-like peptidoglycan-associated protein